MRFIACCCVAVFLFCLSASALTVTDGTVGGLNCYLITWTDHHGKQRTASMLKTGQGGGGGLIPQMTYYTGTTLVTLSTSASAGACSNGFGGVVHHNRSGSASCGGSTITLRLQNGSMAIFDGTGTMSGTVETFTYTFLDGLDYFQYGVTDDTRNGTADADTRTPYCDMPWAGANHGCEGL
jgi:hypothetical protein